MNGTAHHSFKEMFENKEAQALPYNHTPDQLNGAGEISLYISIPIKRNAHTVQNSAKTQFLTLFNQTPKCEYPAEVKDTSEYCYAHLDFKKALIGHINGKKYASSSTNPKDNYSAFESDFISPKLADTQPHYHGPSPAQWYAINQLRITAGAPERSVNGLQKLVDYHAQLSLLELKFPFDTDEVKVGFLWYGSFYPERQFITNCIQYEKASVLFNIAAVYSQLGALERLGTGEGLKTAAVYFQKAAGMFVYIRDHLAPRLQVKLEANDDLQEATLTGFSSLMLAQAAECYYQRATQESSTSSLTAVIAIYVSDIYKVALQQLKGSEMMVKSKIPKGLSNHIKAKYNLYAAIAQFHTGPSISSDRAVAERLVRLEAGKKLISTSIGYAKEVGGFLCDNVMNHAKNMTLAYLCVDAANDEGIHETPFDERLLAPIRRPPQALVHPIDPKELLETGQKFYDVLEGLISSENKALLDEIKQKAENTSVKGQAKMQALLTHYGNSIPDLGEIPLLTEAKYLEMREQGDKMLFLFNQLESSEKMLSIKELLLCMRRINTLSDYNLRESLDILHNIQKGEKTISAKDSLELQNIQNTVKEQKKKQTNLAGTTENFFKFYETEFADFDALQWSNEKLQDLFPILKPDYSSAAEIQRQWSAVKKEIEKEKSFLKDSCQKCQALLDQFKAIQNGLCQVKLIIDKWSNGKTYQIKEVIKEREKLILKLENDTQKLELEMEKSILIIKSKERIVAQLLDATREMNGQKGSISSFKANMLRSIKFKKELISQSSILLEFRLKSCCLFYLCLGLLGDGKSQDYIDKNKRTRDPELIRMVHSDLNVDEKKNALFNCPPNLLELKQKLLDTEVLPLQENINFAMQNFWKNIDSKSQLLMVPETGGDFAGLDHIEYDIPEADFSRKFFQEVPRKPINSLPGQGVRSISFGHLKSKPAHNSKPNIFSAIYGAKDAVVNLFSTSNSGKKEAEKGNERQSGVSKEPKISKEIDIEPNEYVLEVMRENARLRGQVLKMRTPKTKDEISIVVRSHSLSDKEHQKTSERSHNLRKWIEKQANYSNEPQSLSSESQSEIDGGQVQSRARNIEKAKTIAAAIAAGVTAAQQVKDSDHRFRNRRSKSKGNHEIDILNSMKETDTHYYKDKKIYRDDSGVKVSSRDNSTDNIILAEFRKPNLTQMKNDNDRLAKALGLL